MRLVKKENIGIQEVYNTNVEQVGTYVSNGCIINKNCVVDADYQGEVHINLINTNENESIQLMPGDKIIQGILLKVKYAEVVEVPFEELYASETERGTGGFGSTDEVING